MTSRLQPRCKDGFQAVLERVDLARLVVEVVGFYPQDVVDARVRWEGMSLMLDVDVHDSEWEPTFEFKSSELRNLPTTDGAPLLAGFEPLEIWLAEVGLKLATWQRHLVQTFVVSTAKATRSFKRASDAIEAMQASLVLLDHKTTTDKEKTDASR